MKQGTHKKAAAALIAALAAFSALAGCSKPAVGEGEAGGSVNIMVWAGSYPEEVFGAFEEETGIDVNVTYIVNTDEILAKLIASGGKSEFDMIDLESAYIKPFVDNSLLQELDYANIPNYQLIREEKRSFQKPGDPDAKYTCLNGNEFYTLIVYNKETCPIEIKSFKDLANPALRGQICSVNSTISLFGEALVALGYQPDSTTESEYAQAADLWSEIKKNVKVFTGSTNYQTLENGECSVAFCFDYTQLMSSADNWDKYSVADIIEPYEAWTSTWAIPQGASNKKGAEMLMNFLLSPEIYAKRLEFYPFPPMIEEAKQYLSPALLDNPALNMPPSVTEGAWMIPVSDAQVDLMDKYLTKFMSENQ